MIEELIKKICDAIEYDISHRRGLSQMWEEIDEEIRNQEIKDSWKDEIRKILNPHLQKLKSDLARKNELILKSKKMFDEITEQANQILKNF